MDSKPKILERDVLKQCIEWLNYQNGTTVWRANVSAMAIPAQNGSGRRFVRSGVKGQADITGVSLGGRRVEIEVKAAGKKPMPHQSEWLNDMYAKGAIAYWADSLDMCIAKWKARD